jgi:hypothetical protein
MANCRRKATFATRRFPRAATVVETSCKLAQWEVEHTPGVDVATVMVEAQRTLAQPF